MRAARDIFNRVNEFADCEWGRGHQTCRELLARVVGERRGRVLDLWGGEMVRAELSHVVEARASFARRKCAPGGDGVRPQQRMTGVSDDDGDIFVARCRRLTETSACTHNRLSQVCVLVKDRTKDWVDNLRPVGVVSGMQDWGAMILMKAVGNIAYGEDQRLR